jgi:hypothetical protein
MINIYWLLLRSQVEVDRKPFKIQSNTSKSLPTLLVQVCRNSLLKPAFLFIIATIAVGFV